MDRYQAQATDKHHCHLSKGAMLLKAEDCSGEVKDAQFIANVLIKSIEQIGPKKAVQVITDNALVCKDASLIVESRFDHIF